MFSESGYVQDVDLSQQTILSLAEEDGIFLNDNLCGLSHQPGTLYPSIDINPDDQNSKVTRISNGKATLPIITCEFYSGDSKSTESSQTDKNKKESCKTIKITLNKIRKNNKLLDLVKIEPKETFVENENGPKSISNMSRRMIRYGNNQLQIKREPHEVFEDKSGGFRIVTVNSEITENELQYDASDDSKFSTVENEFNNAANDEAVAYKIENEFDFEVKEEPNDFIAENHFNRINDLSDGSLTEGGRISIKQEVGSGEVDVSGNVYYDPHMSRDHHYETTMDQSCHYEVNKFMCSICKEIFSQQEKLTKHLRVHTADINYHILCSHCKREFRTSALLVRHACRLCNLCFASRSLQKQHMSKHKEKNPYQCPMCTKRFSYEQSLLEHIKTHTEEKPFPCGLCGKAFSYRQSLKHHIGSHKMERPFKCKICEKSFSNTSNLKKHVRYIHHGNRPMFTCEHCQSSFAHKESYLYHMKRPNVCFSRKKDKMHHEIGHELN